MKKIFILAFILFLFGCKSVRYIPTITVKDSIVYVNRIKHDSINNYVRDSIYIHQKGDTVFVSKWHYDVKYKELIKNDTINKNIYSKIVNTVEVNRLNLFQKISMWIGIIFSIWAIISIIVKFKKKV